MSDLMELKAKIEEGVKALHDERQKFEELKAEQQKGRISDAEVKERMEKLEANTDKLIEQRERLEKMEAAVQRLGQGANHEEETKGIDQKALAQGFKEIVRTRQKLDSVDLSALQLSDSEKKSLSNAIGTDGGFRIVADRDSEIGKILYDTSNLRAVARVVTTSKPKWNKWIKDTAAGAAWAGELDAQTVQANAKGYMLEIPVHGVYSWQGVTEEHFEDADYDVFGELTMDAGEEIRRKQNTAFITGAGVDRPEGITTAKAKTSSPGVYARGQVGTKVTSGATTISFDELMDVQDSLKEGWNVNATWLMNRATRSYVRKLKYSSGTNEYIWELSTQVGVPSNMLGKPVQIMEDMPGIATGNISIVYGDIRSAYTIVDRIGMSVLDDPYTGNGYLRYFKFRSRVGGAISNHDAIKYLKQA